MGPETIHDIILDRRGGLKHRLVRYGRRYRRRRQEPGANIQVASLTAGGSHSLYIGSVSDSNYYSVPWCRIQVQYTPAG